MNRPRRLSNWPRLAGPAVLTAVCGAGFAVVYVLTVRTTPGRQFGDASLRGAQLTSPGVADAVDAVLGVVSTATLFAGIAAIALIALARLQRVPGMVAVGLVLAANASTWLLKNHLLSRPDLGLSEVAPATHNSLPSGHTTAVFSVVVAVLFVAPVRWRGLVAAAGGSGSVAMAAATMSAGWHRAGDSIAAFALVGAWAGLAALLAAFLAAEAGPAHAPANRGPDGGSRRWLVAMTVASAGLAVGLAVVLALVRPLRTSATGEVFAFLAGALLIIAAAVGVLIGVQLALASTDR